MLYRKIESTIESHLKSDSKKILLIDGARQVGKTYIIRYVGQKLYDNFIEINMVEDAMGDRLFENAVTVVSNLYLKEYYERRNKVIANYYFNVENGNADWISWFSTPKEKPES